MSFWAAALFAGQLVLGEVTRQRPKRTSFEDFVATNEPDETRPIPYAGGTVELTPARIWYGDYKQRAVERDSHWSDYIFLGGFAALLDFITVAYRSYVGEMFPLCWGPDAHVEQIFIKDRLMFQAIPGTDNAGGGFLIDDPQAWGGDQPPGEGGEYAWCDLSRGNYTDHTNAYIESQLTTPPNKTPSLRGISTLYKRGPSGFEESGYFHAGGPGAAPTLKEWKVVVRRQPNNLATAYSKIGRGMNPMEVIFEWSTSLEYGAQIPLEYLNLTNWRSIAQQLHAEGNAWSGKIETPTDPGAVVDDVLKQIDAVKDISPSLGLTFRLIRRDYSFPSLRVLDRDVITRVDRFSPGTYEDTVSKVRVEFPDIENNHKDRPALYIDTANELITRRQVPQSQQYLGVSDFQQANQIATREGRAQSLPRAPLECFVMPSWGRLTYRGEVVLFEWSSPTFSIVMRVLNITPSGPDEKDYRLVLIEDQFASGLRTSGDPGATSHVDPGAGLDVAPPSATWNTGDFPPDGLRFTLTLTNTNQFVPMIEGGIVFGAYNPGGQYARVYVAEPGGVQTLAPFKLPPDANNESTFTWPANGVGLYQFCVQTFSTRGATNEVKVCAEINIAAIGSPSPSPSASISPSSSASASPSASASISPSASQSPSASISASISASLSPSSSASPSSSISPSASQSPSSSASPSAPASPPLTDLELWLMADADAYNDAGTTLATDGQTVQEWHDQSGNGNNATQATSADRPVFRTNRIGSLPALEFGVAGESLLVPDTVDLSMHQDSSVFAVVRASVNLGSINSIVSKANGGSPAAYLYYLDAAAKPIVDRPFVEGGVAATNSIGTTDPHVIAVIISGTSLSHYLDGTANGTDTLGNGTDVAAEFGVGVMTNSGNNFVGDIGEILVYKSALNSTDRDLAIAYLMNKWGV